MLRDRFAVAPPSRPPASVRRPHPAPEVPLDPAAGGGSYLVATGAALRQTALSLVGAWTALVVVQGLTDAIGNGPPMAAVAVAVGAAVAYAWLRSSLPPLLAVLAAAQVWGLSVAAAGPTGLGSTYFVWQEMLVVAASLSLAVRPAVTILVGTTAATTSWLLVTGVDVVDATSAQVLLLALGLLAVASRSTLVAAAATADANARRRLAVELQAVSERARREELLRVQRTMHDTVLNTLAGLRLPGRRDAAQVRARCRADLVVLDDLLAPALPGNQTSTRPATSGAAATATAAADDSGTPAPSITGGLVAGALGLVVVLGLLVAAGSVTPVTSGAAALATFAALLVVLGLVARAGTPLAGPVGAVLAVAAATVVVAAGWSAPSCGALADPPWPTVATAALLWLMALAGSPLRWLALGAAALVTADVVVSAHVGGAACVATVGSSTAYALVGVAAAAVLVVAQRRLSRRATAERLHAAQLAEWTEILAAMDDVRELRVRSAMGGAAVLLRALADGDLDPADPDVVRRCAVEEAQLRSMLALGPVHHQSGQLLARVVLAAHDHGHLIELAELPHVPQPTLDEVDLAVDVLSAALAAFTTPTTATLTAFADPFGGGAVSLVIDGRAPGLRASTSQRGRLRVSQSVFDDQVMVEVTWPG